MGRGVAGIGADGLFKHLGGFALFTFGCVQHGEVVIGLRQSWVFLCERSEDLNGLVKLLLFGCHNALQKAHLHIVAVLFEMALNALRCFVDFAAFQQLVYLRHRRLRSMYPACTQCTSTDQSCSCYRA